jgi:hypothetical protein
VLRGPLVSDRKWYIRFERAGYYVNVNDRYDSAEFTEDLEIAKGFISRDNAESIAHKMWLVGFGEYDLLHLEEPEGKEGKKVKLGINDYSLMAYMGEIVDKTGAVQIQLTHRPTGPDRLWEVVAIDANCFFKSGTGRTPQEAAKILVKRMSAGE